MCTGCDSLLEELKTGIEAQICAVYEIICKNLFNKKYVKKDDMVPRGGVDIIWNFLCKYPVLN